MATAKKTTPRGFSDEDLISLMALMRGSDSVELKLTVPESDQRSTVLALGLDPLRGPDPAGVLLRHPRAGAQREGSSSSARGAIQGKGDDSVVKLRPVVPDELPEALRRLPGFGVEVDAMPGGFVCSGRLKEAVDPPIVRSAVAGERPLRRLFTKEQRKLYAAHAPEGIALDDLSVLGPIFVLKLRFTPKELERRIVAELWLYPDGSRLLELSTKCAPSEAFQVAAEVRAFLAGHGVDLSGEQETKTRKALTYFAAVLRDGGR